MANKVLIVDDEAFIRLLIEQTLENLEERGVLILTADNGQSALEMVQKERPNLVFLDIMLPRLNGFEVCEVIKRTLKMENVFVVILTAKGQEFDRQRGEQAGADSYMTKPFDPDELVHLAEKVLAM